MLGHVARPLSSPAGTRRGARRRLPAAIALALILVGRGAWAGGLDFDLVGARAIGRAGATMVSGDGGTALVVNPAGLARSTHLCLQLGVTLHDDDGSFRAPDPIDPDDPGPPTVADRASPALAPSVSVHGALGSVVVGA